MWVESTPTKKYSPHIQWIIPKKTGFNLYKSRHCAYTTYSVKTCFLKNLSVRKSLSISKTCSFHNNSFSPNYPSCIDMGVQFLFILSYLLFGIDILDLRWTTRALGRLKFKFRLWFKSLLFIQSAFYILPI